MVKLNFIRVFVDTALLTVIDLLTRYFGVKKQFLPDSDELENKEVIELLERLKGKSEKETLSNLLEWQNRNISYWVERGYLDSSLRPLLIVGIGFIFLFTSIPLLASFYILFVNVFLLPPNASLRVSFFITLALLLWVVLKANTFLKITYVILWSYPLYEVVRIELLKTPTPQNISLLLNFTVFNWIIFGISLFSLLYLAAVYWPMTRQVDSLKSKIKEIATLIKSTFEVSIQLSTILKYKLAICTDYAKLTAILLYNMFPNNRIYFISIPRHVAAGIEVNGKLYIIDQKLPVLTLDSWLRVWNRKTATIYQLKVLDSKNRRKLKLEKRGMTKLANPSINVDTEKLTDEVDKLLKIGQTTQKNSVFKIPIPIPRLAKRYDNDEIVIYSMARAIKRRLENELCSNLENIEKIEIKQNSDDLIVSAYLKK